MLSFYGMRTKIMLLAMAFKMADELWHDSKSLFKSPLGGVPGCLSRACDS